MENPVRADLPKGLTIFETMRAEGGEIALLPLHLDRMCDTCRALGVPFDRAKMHTAVTGAIGAGSIRVRLALTLSGQYEVGVFAMPDAAPTWRVEFAQERVTAGDFWRAHKTSHRAIYDTARAALQPDIDELLFLNDRGDCAEGTITNLFVDPGDGMLRTPPLSAGVLPGVLRRSLIETGRASVARITPGDLRAAKQVFMGNALRGLIPVSLDISAPT